MTIVTNNWRPNSPRYHRVARFVDELFSRANKLQAPSFDPKWKDVNPTTGVAGLERFQPAQEWLDRTSPAKQSGHP
jgi:hypothetical protein